MKIVKKEKPPKDERVQITIKLKSTTLQAIDLASSEAGVSRQDAIEAILLKAISDPDLKIEV
jgi:predicted DNA binding CopG/RHH family protein